MGDFAVAVMAWQRPEYLARCLESVAANDLSGVDVHVWQEGLDCHLTGIRRTDPAGQAGNRAAFERAALPSKEWHQQDRHVGIAIQRLTVLPYLAEHYDSFLCLDDDVVIGRHCLRVMRRLLDQFGANRRVGTISAGMRLLCAPEDVERYRDAVVLNEGRTRGLYAEAMTAAAWREMEPHFRAYCDLVADVPYHQIGRLDVRDRVAAWAESVGSDVREVSSDTALLRSVLMAGRLRMCLVVNRAANIGEQGLHCTPEILAGLGIANQPIHESARDARLRAFRIVEEGE